MKKSYLIPLEGGVSAVCPRRLSTWAFASIAVMTVSFAASTAQAINHRPIVSAIADQRTTQSTFNDLIVVVSDPDAAASTLTVMPTDYQKTWSGTVSINFIEASADSRTRRYSVTTPSGVGSVTIAFKVTDQQGAKTYTSCTLQRYSSSVTLPTLGGVSDQTVHPTDTYSATFMSTPDDRDTLYTPSAKSSNQLVVQDGAILFDQRTRDLPKNTVHVPTLNTTGTAIITVTLAKDTTTYATTSFVIDTATGPSPSITRQDTFLVSGSLAPLDFTVAAGSGGNLSDIRLSATSSNPSVVANDSSSFAFSSINPTTGQATIAVTPKSGAPKQAATITVTATNGTFKAQTQFLYVLKDTTTFQAKVPRPSGVYTLDGPDSPQPPYNPFGYPPNEAFSLRDANMDNIDQLPFVDGYVLRVPWTSIEDKYWDGSPPEGTYDFHMIDNALAQLGPNQVISVIITGEPNYVTAAAIPDYTWEDPEEGTRPVPWFPYMRERWEALMAHMADWQVPNTLYTLATHPQLAILNPSLPGAQNGIRDPIAIPATSFADINDTYSREELLGAIEDYLTSMQIHFPGKFVQIGFWTLTDDGDGGLTEDIRNNLIGLYDGRAHPRVGFWEENLSANRGSAATEYVVWGWDDTSNTGSNTATAYLGGPDTGFAVPLDESKDSTWIGFQMLSAWSQPFNNNHIPKTLNASPSDGFEYSYNTYYGQYCETYRADVDFPAFTPLLQSWYDYFATLITAPLNLDVTPTGTQVHVTWAPVHHATSYDLQFKAVTSINWTTVSGLINTYYDHSLPNGTGVIYQVRANNGSAQSDYSLPVDVFRSNAINDGYVNIQGATNNTATSNGITAGEQSGSKQVKGIVSFSTSYLGSEATVGGAKLALKQSSNSNAFSSLGDCHVDIKMGAFGGAGLEPDDFDEPASFPAPVATTPAASANVWAIAPLDSNGIANVYNSGDTQLRVYFDDNMSLSNIFAGWYSGNSTGNEPLLIVQYSP
jgi:hypothetical protein